MRREITFCVLVLLGIFAIAKLVEGADTSSGLYGRLHRYHRHFYSPRGGSEIDTTGSATIRDYESFRDDTTGHGTAWTVNELADGHWTWYVDNHPTELVDIYYDSAGTVVKLEEDFLITGRVLGDSTIAASTDFLAAVVPSAALIDDAVTPTKLLDTADFIMNSLTLNGMLVTDEIQSVGARVYWNTDFRANYIDTDSIAATGDVLKVIATDRLDFATDTLKAASGDAVVCVGVWGFSELIVTLPATFDDIAVMGYATFDNVISVAGGTAGQVLKTHGGGNNYWGDDVGGAAANQEEVEDWVGAMSDGNTETGIAVDYQDGDGTVDYVVDHDAANNFLATEHVDWAAGAAGTIHTDNYVEDEDLGVNEAYGAGWNADADSPEKDDVYDYLHLIDTNDDGDVDNLDATAFATALAANDLDVLANVTALTEASGDLLYVSATFGTGWDRLPIVATPDYVLAVNAAGEEPVWAAVTLIVHGTDPDVDVVGEISNDNDGANETGDVSLRGYDGSNQFAFARKLKCIGATIIAPNDLDDATRDKCMIWSNESGMTFTITKIEAWADTDDTAFTVEEYDADGAANQVDVDEINCTTGSGPYTDTETTISNATIEADHTLWIDFDDTDDPGWVKVTICGWFDADVD